MRECASETDAQMKVSRFAVLKSRVSAALIDVDFRLIIFRQRPFDGGVRADGNEFILRREMQHHGSGHQTARLRRGFSTLG